METCAVEQFQAQIPLPMQSRDLYRLQTIATRVTNVVVTCTRTLSPRSRVVPEMFKTSLPAKCRLLSISASARPGGAEVSQGSARYQCQLIPSHKAGGSNSAQRRIL